MDPCSFIMSGFVWPIWNTCTGNVPNARQNSIQILTSMRNVHSAKKNQSESRCILCQWRAGRLQLTDHISLLKSKCVPYYVSIGQILEQKSSKKGVTWCPSIFFEGTFLLWHLQVGCILNPNIAANQTLRPVNSINHRSDEKLTVELQRHLHQLQLLPPRILLLPQCVLWVSWVLLWLHVRFSHFKLTNVCSLKVPIFETLEQRPGYHS
jgi:hypothetical protein